MSLFRLHFIFLLFLIPLAADAGYREDFQREFMTATWAGQQGEENYCIDCHTSDKMKPAFIQIAEDWQNSWHAMNRISCHDCHGGDPKDATMAMSSHRGFVGKPKPTNIPDFCGRCHVGILKNYLESGHGKAFKTSGKGPHCVACHGSHTIQKANIDIINEQLCSKCHTYERAKLMKQALFLTEKKFDELDGQLKKLKKEGVFIDDEERSLFSTQAEFRTLFHTVDVDLVKDKTDDFGRRLEDMEDRIGKTFRELRFRKNFSAFILIVFCAMAIVVNLLIRTPKE